MIFNGKKKQKAIERYERQQGIFYTLSQSVVKSSSELFEIRSIKATSSFTQVKTLFNNIYNLPSNYFSSLDNFVLSEQKLLEIVSQTTEELSKVDVSEEEGNWLSVENVSLGAGLATGASVAVFGPSTAIAIATTFGTASTGAAISSLSGAAVTTASLAWLGGGAISAGGAGMAGGYALLSLAGPIGLAIAGTSVALFSMDGAHDDAIKINNTSDHIALVNKEFIRSLDAIHKIKVKLLKNITSIDCLFPIINDSLTSLDYNTFNDMQKRIISELSESLDCVSKLLVEDLDI